MKRIFWPQPKGDHVYLADDCCIFCGLDADDVWDKPCVPNEMTKRRNAGMIALWDQTKDQYVITEEQQRRIDAIFAPKPAPVLQAIEADSSHPSPDHSELPGSSGG